jgi:hypothetical protein
MVAAARSALAERMLVWLFILNPQATIELDMQIRQAASPQESRKDQSNELIAG